MSWPSDIAGLQQQIADELQDYAAMCERLGRMNERTPHGNDRRRDKERDARVTLLQESAKLSAQLLLKIQLYALSTASAVAQSDAPEVKRVLDEFKRLRVLLNGGEDQ